MSHPPEETLTGEPVAVSTDVRRLSDRNRVVSALEHENILGDVTTDACNGQQYRAQQLAPCIAKIVAQHLLCQTKGRVADSLETQDVLDGRIIGSKRLEARLLGVKDRLSVGPCDLGNESERTAIATPLEMSLEQPLWMLVSALLRVAVLQVCEHAPSSQVVTARSVGRVSVLVPSLPLSRLRIERTGGDDGSCSREHLNEA